MKFNWYKPHDVSSEKLQACSTLLLKSVPIQRWARRARVKTSSGNVQGRGDGFIPHSCTGDSDLHHSLHLKKWGAAWQAK